uniref:Uncharacterized protein n=1 Tax=Brassica campestris TaxID=3711 RepID=A0A3P6DEN8_BRACM|nr:unnamed protein product [Brassica rapa]
MMKKNHRGKGVWSHTSDEAPWKICKITLHFSKVIFAHVNERQPEAQSLSNKSYFKLEEKKGQKSQHCKEGLTKDRWWIFNPHLKQMYFQ